MTNKEAQDTIRELNKLLDTAKEIIDKQRGCLDLCLDILGLEQDTNKEDMYDNLNKLLKGGGVKKFE